MRDLDDPDMTASRRNISDAGRSILSMRIISIAVVCLLIGCVNEPTVEELEAQALISGDWSEVEKRERSIAKRENSQALSCPQGMMNYCYDKMSEKTCECVPRRR